MEERLSKLTRAEWHDLGFSYDRNDQSKEWHIVGSRAGLSRFAAILRSYVADPAKAKTSEHEHYGPYMYLELMTSAEPGMDDHAIFGPLEELTRLASVVEARAARLRPGMSVRIREEYAPTSPYALVLHLREDTFDPASADPCLGERAG